MVFLINGIVTILLLLFFVTLSIESSNNDFSLRKKMLNNAVLNFRTYTKLFARRFQ